MHNFPLENHACICYHNSYLIIICICLCLKSFFIHREK